MMCANNILCPTLKGTYEYITWELYLNGLVKETNLWVRLWPSTVPRSMTITKQQVNR